MKLIYCPDCEDVFKLDLEKLRSCKCGKCSGKYIDRGNAEVNGQGVSLAISNPALWSAIARLSHHKNQEDVSDHYKCPDAWHVECWVRPHEGTFNPRTKIRMQP
jgi:hypothetical protein